MKRIKTGKLKSYIAPIVAIAVSECLKHIPVLTDLYTDHIYPIILNTFHTISSILPFSIYDILVVISILMLLSGIVFVFIKRYRKLYFKTILLSVLWIYAWFYLAWGVNYFGKDFYERTSIPKANYDSLAYDKFINKFCDSLNSTFIDRDTNLVQCDMRIDIETQYNTICSIYNLPKLPSIYKPKSMLYSRVYAAVGVTGYYGPLLSEIHLNSYLLADEKPFLMAHETAHLLGVTSEAEANLYGYLVTTSSSNKAIRFSGYFEMIPFVLNNYRKTVNDSTYAKVYQSINPEIFKLYNENRKHWSSLKRERAKKVQSVAHNTYLKVNNIPQGVANYSEVVALILSVESIK